LILSLQKSGGFSASRQRDLRFTTKAAKGEANDAGVKETKDIGKRLKAICHSIQKQNLVMESAQNVKKSITLNSIATPNPYMAFGCQEKNRENLNC
jgi:hypothetical protein